jgi:hypothetical protein
VFLVKGLLKKPKKRWFDDVENDLKKMDVTGWR